MLLPQHHVELPAPALVQLAEAAVAIAVRVGFPVLLPEQLQVTMRCCGAAREDAAKSGWGAPSGWLRGWSAREQRRFQPSRHPSPSGSGQVTLAASARFRYSCTVLTADRATARDLPLAPGSVRIGVVRTSLILRMDILLAGKLILPLEGRLPAVVMSSAATCGNHSGEAEHHSGIGLKLFGFIPESCSPSSRNRVRDQPGTLFGFTPESRSPSPGIPKQTQIPRVGRCDRGTASVCVDRKLVSEMEVAPAPHHWHWRER